MRITLIIVLFFISLNVVAQSEEAKLTTTIKAFHADLVKGNTISINQQTDKALSYGHSSGWVETKTDMLKNLETGVMKYNSYKEDSLAITMNGAMANARFIADLSVTQNGNTSNIHLKVLEVWIKKGKRWMLFARQAVR